MCFSEKFYWLPKSQGLRIARQTFELIQGQLELPYSVSTSKHSKQVKTYELRPIYNSNLIVRLSESYYYCSVTLRVPPLGHTA